MLDVYMNGLNQKIMNKKYKKNLELKNINLHLIHFKLQQLKYQRKMNLYQQLHILVLEKQQLPNMQLLWQKEINKELYILHQLKHYQIKNIENYNKNLVMLDQ